MKIEEPNLWKIKTWKTIPKAGEYLILIENIYTERLRFLHIQCDPDQLRLDSGKFLNIAGTKINFIGSIFKSEIWHDDINILPTTSHVCKEWREKWGESKKYAPYLTKNKGEMLKNLRSERLNKLLKK